MIPSKRQSMTISNNMGANNTLRKKWHSILGVCVFILYLMCLFYFLFFAEAMGRSGRGEYRYNLTLLKEIRRFMTHINLLGWKSFFLNVIGNVLAFVPFGFFFPMLLQKHKNILVATAAGFLFSLMVESLQLCMKLGSFDVDDLLLNTIGTLIGAICYVIVRLIMYHQRTEK